MYVADLRCTAILSASDKGKIEIKKNIEIQAHFASKQALAKIEKVGCKISIIKK